MSTYRIKLDREFTLASTNGEFFHSLAAWERSRINGGMRPSLACPALVCGWNDRVLEIGTGSGYQAAVLSQVGGRVYSVEIIPELARQSAARLTRLGYTNVETRHGDGYAGWPEFAPYDGVLVTAAAPAVPPPLIEQLKEGRRLVLPVGPRYGYQELMVIEKRADGSLCETDVLGVVFIPLTRMPPDSQGERV